MPDAGRLGAGEQVFGVGEGRRQRPLAVHVLAGGDGGTDQLGVVGSRRQDDHQVHVRVADEPAWIVEGVRHAELLGDLDGVLLAAARHGHDLVLGQEADAGRWPYRPQFPTPTRPTRIFLLPPISPAPFDVQYWNEAECFFAKSASVRGRWPVIAGKLSKTSSAPMSLPAASQTKLL